MRPRIRRLGYLLNNGHEQRTNSRPLFIWLFVTDVMNKMMTMLDSIVSVWAVLTIEDGEQRWREALRETPRQKRYPPALPQVDGAWRAGVRKRLVHSENCASEKEAFLVAVALALQSLRTRFKWMVAVFRQRCHP